MKCLIGIWLFITGICSVFGQNKDVNSNKNPYQNTENLKTLTLQDSLYFNSLPKFELYEGFRNRSLPYMIDNSVHSWFRPVYNQYVYECGQASSIGMCFSYEVNYERNVPGNIAQNQYVPHFAYNFQNGAIGYGVSYMHTFEVLKHCGVPNSVDYGGMYHDNFYWMSGYNKYYNAMHNRIISAYTIDVSDEEGLDILKQWIYDHANNSSAGGLAVFYAQSPWGMPTLPAGTEEAGKYVHYYWGTAVNHAMTIVGFNDSIRYDYNGDGQYTKNIDINNDGIVNMKDWEIGGLKFCNTYGGGPSWGNGGFCYMMYKSLAEDKDHGGIWNHAVHVMRAKPNCEPQLAVKILLKHTARNRLKISVGAAIDTAATSPEFTIDFPIFNYQGGLLFMLGDTTEASKTIEFGLDVTQLLNYLNNNDFGKIFLMIDEDDMGNAFPGEIISYSLMDYTTGSLVETTYPYPNVNIVNSSHTCLKITKNFSHDIVSIIPNTLPIATVYQDYNFQMLATGGESPYSWDIAIEYPISQITGNFPTGISNSLTIGSNNFAYINIPFPFPFYDQIYNRLAVHDWGALFVIGGLCPWAYYHETSDLLYYQNKVISPMFAELLSYSSTGDGIFYSGNQDSLVILWDATYTSYDIKFAVTIYPDGNIKYRYGSMPSVILNQIIGISEGDVLNYQRFTENLTTLSNNTYLFEYPGYPKGLVLSTDGLLHGALNEPYNNAPLKFIVKDQNNITESKTLYISTDGVIINYNVNAGSNGIIDYGETVSLDIILANTYPTDVDNASMSLSTLNPSITMIDGSESIGTVLAYSQDTFYNAFSFTVSENIPDNFNFDLSCNITSVGSNWQRDFTLTARAPNIRIESVFVADGNNNRLDPGEIADIIVGYKNLGGSDAYNVNFSFSTVDTNIIISGTPLPSALFQIDSVKTVIFTATVHPNAASGNVVAVISDIQADLNYSVQENLYLGIGMILEDFETGNLAHFSWLTNGSASWFIDTTEVYENTYSARSGVITHNQSSSLKLAVEFLNAGYLRFYKKVSCEDGPYQDYDYLTFWVDDNEKVRWDGVIDWSLDSFYITQGVHLLEWRYVKDYSVNSGSDCAWVDFITFPEIFDTLPKLQLFPDSILKYMLVNVIDTDTVVISNIGGGVVDYNIAVNYFPGSIIYPIQKSISGSYIECDQNYITTGVPVVLSFEVFNGSTDSEWLKDIFINFPTGVYLDSATNFTGGSGGAMVYDGTTGEDITVNWHGEDGSGWGNIHGGEYAYATIYLTVDTSIINDIIIAYTLMGDIYGATPHTIVSSFIITNLGPQQTWVSLLDNINSVIMSQSNEMLLIFNTNGLQPGTYDCELVVQNSMSNQILLPITLIVELVSNISVVEQPSIAVFPNPFYDNIFLNVYIPEPSYVTIEIYDQLGRKVHSLINDKYLKKGNHTFDWKGINDNMDKIQSGVYYYKFTSGKYIKSGKIIFVDY
ncbi:MAG: T9SS type A sorting domain-containing protein [Bacteroidota bacterium]